MPIVWSESCIMAWVISCLRGGKNSVQLANNTKDCVPTSYQSLLCYGDAWTLSEQNIPMVKACPPSPFVPCLSPSPQRDGRLFFFRGGTLKTPLVSWQNFKLCSSNKAVLIRSPRQVAGFSTEECLFWARDARRQTR